MPRQLALSFEPAKSAGVDHGARHLRRGLPWIRSPVNLKYGARFPQLFRHSDATPIELFFDLFFVANLATFTSIHDINKLEALFSYIGFFSIIWFTWLQTTLHDVRFARDSVVERLNKAFQLATMVGFASTGPSFSSNIRFENRWAFKALTIILALSRLQLSVQHLIAASYMVGIMKEAFRKALLTSAVHLCMGFLHVGVYFLFRAETTQGYYVWVAWTLMFAVEILFVFWVSLTTQSLSLEDTHVNVRMSLLTLIIIGEGVISVTKLVNRIVGRNGWTAYSLVHIFGVSTALYLLWQSYFDLSPRQKIGELRQCVWVALHFPLHVSLILLAEGSEILALALDIFAKIRNLGKLLSSVCKPGRDDAVTFVALLRAAINRMDIDYRHSKSNEQQAIDGILQQLQSSPFSCNDESGFAAFTLARSHDLMGNVTTSLFASMGIEAPPTRNIANHRLLMEYLDLLEFVYLYYFVVAALTMFIFAMLVPLTRQQIIKSFEYLSTGYRLVMAALLGSLTALTVDYSATYRYMTSPIILFTFAGVLLVGLIVDRVLDTLTQRRLANVTDHSKNSGPGEPAADGQDIASDSDSDSRTLVPLSPVPCSTRESRSERSLP
ncbi:hypothetical protein KEM52_002698 [Ascosphaera acerosa]|nr:hypothetical protein KEM52_002698 [Ascosphaera acerosa]